MASVICSKRLISIQC